MVRPYQSINRCLGVINNIAYKDVKFYTKLSSYTVVKKTDNDFRKILFTNRLTYSDVTVTDVCLQAIVQNCA